LVIGFVWFTTCALGRHTKPEAEQPLIDPARYGARGDGVTDDAAAFQAALNSGASRIALQSNRVYRLNSAVSKIFTSPVDFELTGNGAVIDGTACTADRLILLKGTLGPGFAMGSNPGKGETSFTSAGIAGSLARGDKILVIASDPWYAGAPGYYVKGEFAIVAHISGSSISLVSPLNDGYTGVKTQVYKPVLPRICMSDITFRMNGNYSGPEICLATAIDLKNLTFSGSGSQNFYLNWIFRGLATNIHSYNCPLIHQDVYGMIVNAQGLTIKDSRLLDGHHGLSLGGGDSFSGSDPLNNTIPNRDIVIENCTFDNNAAGGRPALNSHANAERITLIHNKSFNGAGIAAIDATFIGNNFTAKMENGAGLQLSPQKSSLYYSLKDNNLEADVIGGRGLALTTGQPNISLGKINIDGGRLNGKAFGLYGIPHSSGNGSIDALIITGTDISSHDYEAIKFTFNGGYLTIGTMLLKDVKAVSARYDAFDLRFTGGGDLQIDGGYFEGHRGPGSYGMRASYLGNLKINGAHFKAPGADNSIFGHITAVTISNTKFEGFVSAGGLGIENNGTTSCSKNDHSSSTGRPCFDNTAPK
jgi:hypothetical protein